MSELEFFEPTLADLQDALPDWWQGKLAGELEIVLRVVASVFDDLAAIAEGIYADMSLATARDSALRTEWALLYGAAQEQLPLDTETLRGYLQTRAAEDGTIGQLHQTLLAILHNPVNDTGTPVRFPAQENLLTGLDPSFEDGTTGGLFTLSAYGSLTATQDWARDGTWSVRYQGAIDAAEDNSLAVFVATASTGELTPATAGAYYGGRASIRMRSAITGAGSASARLAFYTADRGLIPGASAIDGSAHDATVPGELELAVTAQAPADAAYVTLAVSFHSDAAYSVDADLDAFCLYEVDTGTDEAAVPAYVAPGSPLLFPADGSGIGPLFEPTTDDPGLTFPADGTGLTFPADGSELVFPDNPRLTITEVYSEYRLDVTVREILSFDRAAFARAVGRARLAHMLPAVITEV